MAEYQSPRELHVWAVAQTHPSKEELAMQHLARQDFKCYCPMITRRQKHPNRIVDRVLPLFPGYVFVRLSPERPRWRSVMSTVGVRTLIRFGDRLGIVDDSFVEGLKSRESDRIIAKPETAYRIGQKVRVGSGPFDGLIATILASGARDRLTVLIGLLQRHVKVEMPIDRLTAIE